MRRWLRLPTVGLPEAKALLAAEEERRRALRQQLSDAMPESLKSLAGMATDWMGEQFTPDPQMQETGRQVQGLMTEGGPIYGPLARFGVDQAVEATTPGSMMSNLIPLGKVAAVAPLVGKAAKKLSTAAKLAKATVTAAEDVASPVLGGRALGSLAAMIQPGEVKGTYRLVPDTIERLRDLYKHGASLPTTANWESAMNDEFIRAFNGDRSAAIRWARMWGALSPRTDVPENTRQSVAAFLHNLENPDVPFTKELLQSGLETVIGLGGTKFGNLNRAVAGEILSPNTKAEAMAGYMMGEERLPIDVHALYALGAKADKLDAEYPALRGLMKMAEGIPLKAALEDADIYRRFEDAMKVALADFAPGKSVNEIFGTMWEGARAHKGLKYQGGPIDILRKKGLLEMGAMLDPAKLRAALSQQGWSAAAIAALLASLGYGTDVAVPPEGMS